MRRDSRDFRVRYAVLEVQVLEQWNLPRYQFLREDPVKESMSRNSIEGELNL